MKIGEVSKQTGLSTHTIRFYEKQGLIDKPEKDAIGHRSYNRDDVDLFNWVSCLKKSGMSLNKIKHYVAAYKDNNVLVAQTMLEEHLVRLNAQKVEILHYIDVTTQKIRQLKDLT